MGDYLKKLRGTPSAPTPGEKQAELSALRQMAMSFAERVRAMLRMNISSQDSDLLARASMMPWLFPDVAQFQSNMHICIQGKRTRSDISRHLSPETQINV